MITHTISISNNTDIKHVTVRTMGPVKHRVSYYSHPPHYRPSVDCLPPILLPIFKSQIFFF